MKKTPEQRDAEAKANKALIRKWPARLKKLKDRKENPLNERQFCVKYNLGTGCFSRAKNFRVVTRASTVKAVEAALLKEGV